MFGQPQRKTLLKWVLVLLWTLAVGVAQAQVCAAPGRDGVSFSRNTYYPGQGTASAGSSVVSVGAARVDTNADTTPFAAGDLALIIQMQDALINNTDSSAYGDGVAGDPATGSTSLRNAGVYEFKRVVAAAAGSITLDTPLLNTYTTANADATSGHRRFQVLRVPQFASLTLPGGTVDVVGWNGSTGSVMVLDVSGTLALNGSTLNADALGFRGGGSQPTGARLANNVNSFASAQQTSANNFGAAKGEGIAGTPRFLRSNSVVANGYSGVDVGFSGYPSSLDLGRGAPGNAGGGGSQHNAGGGGGGNAGTGGRGGNSWGQFRGSDTGGCVQFGPGYFSCGGDGSRPVGGFGGQGLAPVASRLFLGGGGGAGESNDASQNPTVPQGSGGNGGGLIFVRARSIVGSGVFSANGGTGQPGGNDAAGGGGGGGTVVLVTESASVPGLQVSVNGGAGGNTSRPLVTSANNLGPGGGGGGGAFIRSSGVSVGATSAAGGASGVVTPVAGLTNAFGANGGEVGVANVNFSGPQFPNPSSCFPALTVTKSTTTPTRVVPTDTTAQYVVVVSNASGVGAATGVAITDVLPSPFTLDGATALAQLGGGSLGPTPATASGTSTVTIAAPGGNTASAFFIPPGGGVTLTFQVGLNNALPGTYQNPAAALYSDPTRSVADGTVTPGGTYAVGGSAGGSNYAAAAGTLEDVTVTALTLLSITKTNSVDALTSGSTTTYTITVNNEGPSDAPGTVLTDPAVAGLNCTAVACSVTGGAAVCPVPPALSLASLQGSGVVISTFPANSSLSFAVTCSVTATGTP